MRRTGAPLALVVVLSLALLAAAGGSAAPDAAAKSGKGARLQSFGSCGNLLAYAKQHALPLVGPWGLGGGRAGATPVVAAPAAGGRPAPSGVDYSTTNVQEEGVDEPDIVKSNGSTLFVVRADRLFAVDVRGREAAAGRLARSCRRAASYELLLHGDRLLVLSRGGVVAIDAAGRRDGRARCRRTGRSRA